MICPVCEGTRTKAQVQAPSAKEGPETVKE